MPELPEVETMRRGVLGVVGASIVDAEKVRCTKKPIRYEPRPTTFRRRVVGTRIRAVDRIGKRVVLQLSSSDSIVLEPRMTGLVLVADPPSVAHLRFRLWLSGGKHDQLLYWDRRGLGSVRLLTRKQYDDAFSPARIGPDALEITCEQLHRSLRWSRREIKVALLDQRILAGVGNLYASELLHVAGLHPRKRCDRMTRQQWQRVHSAMRDILLDAIRYEGSTLGDGTYRNALNDPGGYQNHHLVYDREGADCVSCGQCSVQRIVQAQRSTFFCKVCQRK